MKKEEGTMKQFNNREFFNNNNQKKKRMKDVDKSNMIENNSTKPHRRKKKMMIQITLIIWLQIHIKILNRNVRLMQLLMMTSPDSTLKR